MKCTGKSDRRRWSRTARGAGGAQLDKSNKCLIKCLLKCKVGMDDQMIPSFMSLRH